MGSRKRQYNYKNEKKDIRSTSKNQEKEKCCKKELYRTRTGGWGIAHFRKFLIFQVIFFNI